MSENTDWDCPTCGRPTPTEIDVECHCGMIASHHVSISTMCKRLRESQQRESALIVEVNEQARLLGMSAERECDLRGDLQNRRDLFKLQEHLMSELQDQLAAERDLADRLHGLLDSVDFRLAFVENKANGSISEDIAKMRSIIFPALNAWKEAMDLQCSQSPTITK